QRQLERERRALVGRALHAQLATHRADQAARDREAEAGLARGAVALVTRGLERLEDRLAPARVDAQPRVADLEANRAAAVRAVGERGGDDDLTVRRELDGVADEGHQHLAHAALVAVHDRRELRVDVADQLDRGAGGGERADTADLLDDGAQVERLA